MWTQPEDADAAARMRAAHHRACTALRVTIDDAGPREAWGFAGRSLGRPVTTPGGPGWLRVAATESGTQVETYWNGSRSAHHVLPGSIPRPALHAVHDDTHNGWDYRAELFDRAPARPFAHTTAARRLAVPPTGRWFLHLRTALGSLVTVATARRSIAPTYLDHVMPRHLGEPLPAPPPTPWVTAHGDLHWANLCGPTLTILDWEGWGLAPTGYDAATLYCRSLLMPTIAASVHQHFADVLATETGRYAQLAVIAELLDAADHGASRGLTTPLRLHAAHLLGRPVPGSDLTPTVLAATAG